MLYFNPSSLHPAPLVQSSDSFLVPLQLDDPLRLARFREAFYEILLPKEHSKGEVVELVVLSGLTRPLIVDRAVLSGMEERVDHSKGGKALSILFR